MASFIYNNFLEIIGEEEIDLNNDTFKIMLLDDGHTPDADHTKKTDIVGDEISGTGYTAGGETLTNVTWSKSGSTVTFDADDVIWSDSTFTARYAVIYDSTNEDYLVCLFDFNGNHSFVTATFTIEINSSGIFTITKT